MNLKCQYFSQFWSYIDWGLIICAWIILGIYIWRDRELNRIGNLFKLNNGDAYINLQLATYVNDILTCTLGFSCFFASIKLLSFARYARRLSMFGETLHHASKDLFSFTFSFVIMLLAFVFLFYLLFASKISECSTLLQAAQMLFEMILMKFDTSELALADALLGPLCFTAFIFFVVFIGMTMFVSIISDSFRVVRIRLSQTIDEDQDMLIFIWRRFQQFIGTQR